MLEVSLNPYRLTIRESAGLAHQRQVVEVPIPENSPKLFSLRDETSGRSFPRAGFPARPDARLSFP